MKLGVISKPHGIRGEVFIKTFNEKPEWPDLKVLFIKKGSTPLSYDVESYQPHKKGWIFKFKTINDRTQSEKLVGGMVLLLKKQLQSEEGTPFYLAEIKGFSVRTKSGENLGMIVSFSLNKEQNLICVARKGKEILIPFVPDYVSCIEFDKKQLELNLPPSFLEEFNV